APVLSYAAMQSVTVGGALTVMPTDGPSDDGGSINALSLGPVTLSLGTPTIAPVTPGSPAFAGTVTHSTQVGNVFYFVPGGPLDIKNAGPIGSYRVNVPLTDSCGLTTTGTFILNVTCAAPALTYSATNPACPGAHNGQ